MESFRSKKGRNTESTVSGTIKSTKRFHKRSDPDIIIWIWYNTCYYSTVFRMRNPLRHRKTPRRCRTGKGRLIHQNVWSEADSNRRHTAFQAVALPAELSDRASTLAVKRSLRATFLSAGSLPTCPTGKGSRRSANVCSVHEDSAVSALADMGSRLVAATSFHERMLSSGLVDSDAVSVGLGTGSGDRPGRTSLVDRLTPHISLRRRVLKKC